MDEERTRVKIVLFGLVFKQDLGHHKYGKELGEVSLGGAVAVITS